MNPQTFPEVQLPNPISEGNTPHDFLKEFFEDPDHFATQQQQTSKGADQDTPYKTSVADPTESTPSLPEDSFFDAAPGPPKPVTRIKPKAEDIKNMLTVECKNAGIEPYPEYVDVLVKQCFEMNDDVTLRDIQFFLLGMSTDRKYSITTNLKEISQKLETSLKLVSHLERKFNEKSEREDSRVLTKLEEIKMDICKREEQTAIAAPKEDVLEWTFEPPKLSNYVAVAGGPKFSFEELSRVDVSRLPIPKTDDDPYGAAGENLGWGRSVGSHPKFRGSFASLPHNVKLLIHYNLLRDEAKERIKDKMRADV